MGPEYILQRDKDGPICALIAIYNALIYHGKKPPERGSKTWEDYIDLAGARHGAAISPEKVAAACGLQRTPVAVTKIPANLPAAVTVWNPEVGTSLHEALVVGAKSGRWTVVNFRSEVGPVVEEVIPRSLPRRKTLKRSVLEPVAWLPRSGNVNRKAWSLVPA
jgi:hypothetical protein